MNLAELARRPHVSRAYVVALADRGDVSCTRDADGRRTFDDSAAEAYMLRLKSAKRQRLLSTSRRPKPIKQICNRP